MKFSKKPIVIEAAQYDGTEKSVMFVNDGYAAPFTNPNIIFSAGCGECLIKTPEGVMTALPGDWIIRGIKGELYPCKPDIFDAAYEAVIEHQPFSFSQLDLFFATASTYRRPASLPADMTKIFKYELTLQDKQVVYMPDGAKILCVQMQRDSLCLWAMVNPDTKVKVPRTIVIHGTGNPIVDTRIHYIGTVQDGEFVWHVFEHKE